MLAKANIVFRDLDEKLIEMTINRNDVTAILKAITESVYAHSVEVYDECGFEISGKLDCGLPLSIFRYAKLRS